MAPITSYSQVPLATGVPPTKPSVGSQPIATAIGISALPPLLPGGDVLADMLRPPHQDGDFVAAGEHAAIDADIHHARARVLGDHAAIGEDVAAAVEPVPIGHRQLFEIDILAGDDVLLHRAVVDDARRDAAAQHVAADLDQFARMRVGRQPQHHGDAAVARQPVAEDAAAAAIRLVVILDVVEQQRRPGARALRQPHDGAELDIPVDLRFDLAQVAGGLQRGDPAAQIAERHGLALQAHSLPPACGRPADVERRSCPAQSSMRRGRRQAGRFERMRGRRAAPADKRRG